MSDLVDRLRHELGWGIGPVLLCQEAAEEIERLRSDLSAARKVGEEDVANAITAAKRASICLYSEVPPAVAEDVSQKVQAVCEIARAALSRAERAEQERDTLRVEKRELMQALSRNTGDA